jgi:hypothetical protein
VIIVDAHRTEQLLPLCELSTEIEVLLREATQGWLRWQERVAMKPGDGGAVFLPAHMWKAWRPLSASGGHSSTAETRRAQRASYSMAAATRLVITVGSYRPTVAELSADLVRGARDIYVDTVVGARHEAGELQFADLDWSGLRDLLNLASNPPAAAANGYRTFKSVGYSLWDLAAARLAYRLSRDMA